MSSKPPHPDHDRALREERAVMDRRVAQTTAAAVRCTDEATELVRVVRATRQSSSSLRAVRRRSTPPG